MSVYKNSAAGKPALPPPPRGAVSFALNNSAFSLAFLSAARAHVRFQKAASVTPEAEQLSGKDTNKEKRHRLND